MADIAINFRATSAYVTDGAGQTYDIGATDPVNGGVYPVTRGGMTFGWNSAGEPALSNGRDRSLTNDVRLAGMAFQAAGGTSTYRILVQSGHQYNVRLALGDSGAQTGYLAVLKDNATTFATINVPGGAGANAFVDAAGATHASAAAWVSSNTAVARTFGSTDFYIVIGSGSGSVTPLAHVALTDVGSSSSIAAISRFSAMMRQNQ